MSIGVGVGVGIAFSQAPAAASFDPNFELSPDPGFDTPGAWTIGGTGVSITGSAFVADGSTSSNASASATAAGTLLPGTYQVTMVVSANGNVGNFTVAVGGNNISVATGGGTGTFTSAASAFIAISNQTIKLAGSFFSSKSITITSLSVKRTA